MAIIDAQVHAYERDHPGRPWVAVLPGPPEVTGDDLVAAMDAVGVDGALLTSAWTMYRYDASYAVLVEAAHPGRFGLVKPVDPSDPTVAESIADWATKEAAVAIRIMLVPGIAKDADAATDPDDPAVGRVLETAARHSLPVNLLCWGRVQEVAKLAAKHPETMLIIDHMGLQQPFHPPAPAEPFADLPQLLDLAPLENVTVKITGACTLSHQPFPYPDIWDPLARIFDAFGFDRCMWGTDWTRAVNLLTFEQGVEAFRLSDRLSDAERQDLMGRTLARIYGWSPAVK